MRLPSARFTFAGCLLLLLALACQAQAQPTLTISPDSGVVERAIFSVRLVGLNPQSDYVIEILFQGEVVFSSGETSDAAGEIAFPIQSTPDDSPGTYTLRARQGDEVIASAEFELTAETDASAKPKPTLALEPAAIQAGETVAIMLSGIEAFASVSAQITSADGVLIDNLLARATSSGDLNLSFESAPGLPAGIYQVDVFVEAQPLASATLTISESTEGAQPTPALPAATADEPSPTEASLSIAPRSAPLGSVHLVRVSGLAAAETITLDVSYAGESVYQASKTADAAGAVSLELVTEADDPRGDYTVTVLREAGNEPSMTLTATARPAPVQTATTGTADVIRSRLVDGASEFAFDGAAGQYLLISLASSDFDGALALMSQDDRQIAFNDDSRGQIDAAIGPLALPYTGRYRLEISAKPLMMAQGAIDGDYVLTIAEASLETVDYDVALPFTLDADRPARYFALPVETGDSLTATLDSGGELDTLLQVVAPDGSELAFDDDSGPGLDAELSNLIFDRAATYVLAVSSFEEGASGQGSLNIRRNPVQALEDGEAHITLSDKAIRDLVVFDADEDEYLVLNLETISGHVEDLYVTATVDGMEVMSYSTMGVPDELPLAFVMPMSGRVVVTLEKFGYDDGIALAVSLVRP